MLVQLRALLRRDVKGGFVRLDRIDNHRIAHVLLHHADNAAVRERFPGLWKRREETRKNKQCICKSQFHGITLDTLAIKCNDAASQPLEARELPAASPHRRWTLIAVAAVAAIVIFVTGVIVDRKIRQSPPTPVLRLLIPLPSGIQLTRDLQGPARTEIARSLARSSIIYLSRDPAVSGQSEVLWKAGKEDLRRAERRGRES